MKQVLQDYRSGKVWVQDVAAPAVVAGGLLVRNHASLVSGGTEGAALRFGRSNLVQKARSRPDLVRQVLNKVQTDGLSATYRAVTQRLDEWTPLGYSSAGAVLAVGDDVTGFQAGDHVACAGVGYACHAEIVWVPVNLTVKVPDNVGAEAAAFSTLGAIALHGIHKAEVQPGHRVGVIGLGLVGLLTVQALRAYGCPTFGVDIAPKRVQQALGLGLGAGASTDDEAERAALAFSDGAGLDSVIITASTQSSEPVELAGRLCRNGGRICVVGDVGMDLSRRQFYDKELELTVSRSYGPGRYDPLYEIRGIDYPLEQSRWTVKRNMAEFLRLVSEGKVQVEPLIGRRCPIGDAAAAYEALLDGQLPGAVVLRYPDDGPVTRRVQRPDAPSLTTGTVGIGLIGAGSFVRSTLLPALKDLKGAQLLGVATATGVSASRAAERGDFAYTTTDYRDVLGDPNVRLVVVATRHNSHARLVVEALEAGKDVFVEKPLALTVEQLAAVARALEASRGRLMVGFNRRFAPLVLEMKELLGERRRLLMSYTVNAGALPLEHWLRDPEQGGGRILGEVCHFVDLLSHMTGEAPKRVFATGGAGEIPAEDHLAATLEFPNGSIGTVLYSGVGPESLPKERLEVIGEGIALTLNNFRSLTINQGSKRREVTDRGRDKGHAGQLQAFVDAIQKGQPAPVPAEAYLAVSLATLAIPAAIKAGGAMPVDLRQVLAGSPEAADEKPGNSLGNANVPSPSK